MILEKIGVHLIAPLECFPITPGRIYTSSPTLSTPLRIDPPATPPFKESMSSPGLFTSNDRMIIILGVLVKSRSGMGIRQI